VFGPIYEFLKNGTLPADKKRAHAIPYESNQYEIVNDTFSPAYTKVTSNNSLLGDETLLLIF
jgi:hypothetical protein